MANLRRFPSTAGPLIVYANHASWWDPLAFIVISRYFLPTACHYAPMDAVALKHYGFLRKLGLFGIEASTPRGAAQFLRTAREVLSTPNAVLSGHLPPRAGSAGCAARSMHTCAAGLRVHLLG